MNAHLNIYKAYSKQNRESYQLEDDLTRALAIALQENDIFSHQFLKYILDHKEKTYRNLFDDFNGKQTIEIDIQKPIKDIGDFNYLFAVRISGDAMGEDFFLQTQERKYNPITDMYIHIHDVAIIFEVKPNHSNSTGQLFNQALNALENVDEMKTRVIPVDFNWPLLMELAVRVNNYQEAIGKPSRLLDNFISYIKMHNYHWLPQKSLSSLSFSSNQKGIEKRFSDAIDNSENLPIGNRLGIKYNLEWAEEILISLREETKEVKFVVYPGNTKGQGRFIFTNNGEPQFKSEIEINGAPRKLHKAYHIKFFGQRYITGLWAAESDFKTPLYTTENFQEHSGRKKRNTHWEEVESLLDTSFNHDYDWRKKCDWESKIIGSDRSQFDLSFGYEIRFSMPYSEIQQLDKDKNNLETLINLIEEVKNEFKSIVIQKTW